MSQVNEPENDKIPDEEPEQLPQSVDYDWRDRSKPRNQEDDLIIDGWRRRADGTFEKIEDTEAK
ncbi:hypothetical protein WKK05_11935 [Nostoc sp. UHCC 0302]|uniref:hypothetical protein n=1 Tax=Nostoc sp. UHCC 0302 TaxID=3134896 RepID=UPI00311CCE39